jgi:PAS domain S-box-containing protein
METRVELSGDRFFTMSLDMLCTAGFDGFFHSLNPAWTKTLGWSMEQLMSRPFLDFVHPDDREATVRETFCLQSGVDTIAFENRYRHRNGTYRWLLWSATASQEERLYYAVARDITDRHRVEQELVHAKEAADAASKAKGEFLSRMSHELRTPLTSILGFSQLLEMETLAKQDSQEAVRQIRKAGQHLLDIINEVLDMARVESGRIALSIEPVLVAAAVVDVTDLVRPLAGERGIALGTQGSERVFGLHVRADRQRLKQVLINLLGNSVKYCGGGCTVTLGAEERAGGRVRFAVTDTGPGIAPEMVQRLFTPFDRLGADGHGEVGSGIGLALSKGLVEAMGGEIGCEPGDGRGCTFWVDLPISEGALPAAGGAAGGRASSVVVIDEGVGKGER